MAENKSNTEVKEEIIELLRSTGRDGVDDVIGFLEESDSPKVWNSRWGR